MPLPVPFPPAYAWLALTWLGAHRLGRATAERVTRDRGARAVLAIALALVAWLFAVHVASLAAGSLVVGLPIGAIATGAAGLVLAVLARRAPAPPARGRALSGWLAVGVVASLALLAPLALEFHLHDELYTNGHMSIAAELQNGVYPPRHLVFPDLPLRYHYGFDLLVACLTATLRLSIDRAIDVATLALWALSFSLLWVLGGRLVGPRRGWLVPVLVGLGGGAPLTCLGAGPSRVDWFLEDCKVAPGASLNPPVVSYLFQHPWSLGIPLAATILLLVRERRAPSPWARLAALFASLALLSLGEIVLFAGLCPALVVAEALQRERRRARRVLWMVVTALGAALTARALGGFFARAPGLAPLDFTLHLGHGETLRETLLWNAQTFGLLLPLGAAGLWVLGRRAAIASLLAAGGVGVVNLVRYGPSVDIHKFATLAAIALSIATAAALARLLPPKLSIAPARGAIGIALTAASCLWGVMIPLCYALNLDEIPRENRGEPVFLSEDDRAAVALLRAVQRPGDLVYRSGEASLGYAQWGGLPQPAIGWETRAFGFAPERIAAREGLLDERPSEAERWRREGVRFFVLDATSDDLALRADAAAWVADGDARELATFGDLSVIELTPRRAEERLDRRAASMPAE